MLTDIFWEMNEISSRTETETETEAVIGKLQSLICRTGGENISIDHPNKQVKEIFKNYGYKLPQTLSVSSVRKSLQIA